MSQRPAPTRRSLGDAFDEESRFSAADVRRFLQYIAVGVVGLAINEGGLFLVTGVAGFPYVVGGAVGRVTSVAVNYTLNDAWTWRGRGGPGLRQWGWRGLKYVATRLVGMGIGLAALVGFVEYLDLHYLVANVLAIGVGILWGFAASDRLVWPADTARPLTPRLVDAVTSRVPSFDRATWGVLLGAAVLGAAFAVYTTLLYRSYWLTGSDFGAYVHMFDSTLDGQGWLAFGKYRLNNPTGSYWGAHFSLTLLAVLPFYAAVPSPLTLLVLKSVVLAASVPVLWLVARHHVDSDRIAGLLVASYALNPFLWSAWLFDFQEQALLPVLVFGAYYAYATDRHRLFLALFTLVLLTNEFAIIIAAGALAGLVVAAARTGDLFATDGRDYELGAVARPSDRGGVAAWWASLSSTLRTFIVAGLLVVTVKLIAGLVIANFSRVSGIPLGSIAPPLRDLVAGPRVGLVTLLAAAVAHPTALVEALTIAPATKVLYFTALLVPVLFLALYDEVAVGALLPFLGFAWFLSGRPIYYQFGAHYPLYLLPFVYVGAARVLGRFEFSTRRDRRDQARQLLTSLFALVLVLNLVAGLAVGVERNAVPETDAHTRTLSQAIDTIPANASLVTQNEIYPHVATRPNATYVTRPETFEKYQARYGRVAPEYVLYDVRLDSRPVDWSKAVRRAFGDRLGTEYGLYRYQDGIYVFKRGYEGTPRGITEPYTLTRRYDASAFELSEGHRDGGRIRANTSTPADSRNIWFGPYTSLPPGTYTATFRVHVTRATNVTGETSPVLVVNVATEHNAAVVARESVGPTDGWRNVTLTFTLAESTTGIEFRGARGDAPGTVTFDGVTVRLQNATG